MTTATPTQPARLEASSLTLGYTDTAVVRDLDLQVPHGRITVIVGANACGKSTLLRGLARLLRPRSGSVLLDGEAIHRLPTKQVARTLGLLPQNPVAPEGVTVADLVGRGRHPHHGPFGRWTSADDEAVAEALTLTDTLGLADRVVDELSGGQRQRVWIAMALAQGTELLLLDEPTTYLDVAHQVEMLDLLAELNARRGTTIVMVLHDLNLSARYADHLVALHTGRIVAEGSPREVVTEEVVRTVFGLDNRVIDDPVSHTPLVVPVGRHQPRRPTRPVLPAPPARRSDDRDRQFEPGRPAHALHRGRGGRGRAALARPSSASSSAAPTSPTSVSTVRAGTSASSSSSPTRRRAASPPPRAPTTPWFTTWLERPAAERGHMRTYTIRDVRGSGTATTFVVDMVLHLDGDLVGPGSLWASRASVGDRIALLAPRRGYPYGGIEFTPGPGADLLLVGDETAVPAVCTVLEQLPDDARGTAFLEVPVAADVQDVRRPAGVEVVWLAREGDELGVGLHDAVVAHLGHPRRAGRGRPRRGGPRPVGDAVLLLLRGGGRRRRDGRGRHLRVDRR